MLSDAAKQRLKLVTVSETAVRPSWLQLAEGCTPPVIAARIMGCDAETAARRLHGAGGTLRRSGQRYEGTRKIACDIVGVKLRRVPVSDAVASKAVPENGDKGVYRAKDRHLGTISDPPCDAVVVMLPRMEYIDEGNPLRKRIDEAAAAAEMARAA